MCTIEKANQLVNRMMEEDTLNEISALVVDELHMVGDDDRWAALRGQGLPVGCPCWHCGGATRQDPGMWQSAPAAPASQSTHLRLAACLCPTPRGYLLELLLTKVRYATLADEEELGGGGPNEGVQIIGMSATLPNVAAVARWLGGELYETHFRPVTLEHRLKVGPAPGQPGWGGLEGWEEARAVG